MENNNSKIAMLASEIQGGNQSAFDELYKFTNQRAYYVALEFVKKDEDAQDILQESYIKALSKINELDKPESFQSWLNQIVANKSKDFLKKKKPMLFEAEENEVFEILPDEDTSFVPEENLDQNELQRTVMEVLDELNEEKRACVMMMYFEELSVSEIAQTLEIPEGTVKTRLFSARKDLKEKFSKRGITSAYSVAPIGVVLWAMRKSCISAGAAFAASANSSAVLAGVSAATAAGAAGASTAAATTAVATAKASGGIGAKIAAMSIGQKIVAGIAAVAVVAGVGVGASKLINKSDSEKFKPSSMSSSVSDETESYDNSFADRFEYILDENGNAIIVKSNLVYENGDVVIPSEIDGHKVVQIGYADEPIVFDENSYFGDNRNRLYEMFGSCAIEDCDYVTSFTIPATVEKIRDTTFTQCKGLTKFIVDKNNKHFSTDEYGVLFNKDKTKLIAFPSASPVTSYTVPETVTEISPGAFFQCFNLKTLKLSPNMKSIGLYSMCLAECDRVIIPEGVTEIERNSICWVSKEWYFPKSLKKIDHLSWIFSAGYNFYYAGTEAERESIVLINKVEGVTGNMDALICNTSAPF